MRSPARASVLLAGLLLLAFPALAAAEPKPIAKPATITPIKPTSIAPVKPTRSSTPPATPPPAPSPPPAPPAQSSTPPSNTTPPASPPAPPPSTTVVAVSAVGGRDQSGTSVPAPPPPAPTPLGLVAAGERVTSPGTSTPAWKIAVLALLAAAEAFLVVRLVRSRPAGDLTLAS